MVDQSAAVLPRAWLCRSCCCITAVPYRYATLSSTYCARCEGALENEERWLLLRKETVDDEARRLRRVPLAAVQAAPPTDEMRVPRDELLTVQQCASRCKVQPPTIREWVAKGLLPSVRAGRGLRVRALDLENFLQRQASDEHPDVDAQVVKILGKVRAKRENA